MSAKTNIEWTDLSSNPLRYRDATGNDVWACVKKSAGCTHCYSEALALRYHKGSEFTKANMRSLTPYVREKELKELLSTRKTPPCSKVFLCDMTDLFGDWVPFELVDRIFAAMALRPDVTFQVLTKRPERMANYISGGAHQRSQDAAIDNQWITKGDDFKYMAWHWPLPNVFLGTSVENQETADKRIPHLLRVPAAVRFLSCEPLLGPVKFDPDWVLKFHCGYCDGRIIGRQCMICGRQGHERDRIDWVIVGGESGHGARVCETQWIRSIISQCKSARVACFVKQLGSRSVSWGEHPGTDADWQFQESLGRIQQPDCWYLSLKDRKGGDWSEWAEDLRVREFPTLEGHE